VKNTQAADYRALTALDAMAEEWAGKIGLEDAVVILASATNRIEQIQAFVKQAFVEGAYTCYRDACDGKIPWLGPIQ